MHQLQALYLLVACQKIFDSDIGFWLTSQFAANMFR